MVLPPVLHFRLGISTTNHPAIGVPAIRKPPHEALSWSTKLGMSMNYKNEGKACNEPLLWVRPPRCAVFNALAKCRKQCVPRIQVGRSFNVWGSAYTLQKETQDDRNHRGNRVTSRKPLYSTAPHTSARHIRGMSWSQCLHLWYLSCRWKMRGVSKSVHHQFEISWGVN
jgi:hypothetical protein